MVILNRLKGFHNHVWISALGLLLSAFSVTGPVEYVSYIIYNHYGRFWKSKPVVQKLRFCKNSKRTGTRSIHLPYAHRCTILDSWPGSCKGNENYPGPENQNRHHHINSTSWISASKRLLFKDSVWSWAVGHFFWVWELGRYWIHLFERPGERDPTCIF